MTAALAIFAATVALTLGGLVVIAALCLIRGWQDNTDRTWQSVPHEQNGWVDL